MRKILFLGKRVWNVSWVEGYYLDNEVGNNFIRVMRDRYGNYEIKDIEVIPETVGQYTGLTDKNGRKIFDGDVVKCNSLEYGFVNKVVAYIAEKASFVLSSCGSCYDFSEYITFEVIGNIHDNPELLEDLK